MSDDLTLPDRATKVQAQLRANDFVALFAPVPRPRNSSRAFTRLELLAVLAAVALLTIVVTPAVATNKSDSERMICFNNLRLIGRGFQIWAGDHNLRLPWWTPIADGGEFTTIRPGNAWIEYAFVSNELVTPKILACPADSGVIRARAWQEFMSSPFRNNAVSYSLNLHASPDDSQSWLSADRNFQAQPGGNCAANINNIWAISGTPNVPTSFNTRWTNAVHGAFGHLLTTGGSAEFTSTSRLKELVSRTSDDGIIHFLKAR